MRRKWLWGSLITVAVIGIAVTTVYFKEMEYAYLPPSNKIMNQDTNSFGIKANQESNPVYDLWGNTITEGNIKPLADGNSLSPDNGAVQINDEFLKLGRKMFYTETFGNEVFLTDIMGIVNGPLTIPNIMKAIVQLKGKGTTNLQVELAKDIKVGDKTFKKGQIIDTGIDVAKGSYVPLGMPVKYSEGRIKVGVSCAACHATVDRESKMVIEGAPNSDLNAGLLMALATNSTAYFTHTDEKKISDEGMEKLADYLSNMVKASDGKSVPLPDAKKLEEAVDADLVKWSAGNFDSTIDMKNNPAQIPDSFTLGGHPYGWSGFAAAGPFKGLSAFSNNVHAQNADSLAQSEASSTLFGIDKEVYMGAILQNAANPKYRYNPKSGMKPSDFFASVDPTPGVPGVNELIKPPTFPKLSLIAPDGVFASSKGYKVGEQVNSIAAWQNTLVPPPTKMKLDPNKVRVGEQVFKRADCISCHAGHAFTNNRIIPSATIGTEPSRAQALKKTENLFADNATIYAPNTSVPIPPNPKILQVPTGHLDPEQLKLAFAHGDSSGGYKVKGLTGLYWTAPYLHDGGVAVGIDMQTQLGVPGTVLKGIPANPANSLQALVDKELRQKVIDANRSSKELQDAHVQGVGHEFWVDSSTGFTKQQQEGLIQYLLSLNNQQ